MHQTKFPVIDLVATGENILRLRKEKGLSVRDLQGYFGFEEPQAIYKWQKGKSLPTVDNLYALSALLEVPMEAILVPACPKLNIVTGQQDSSCCSKFFWPGCFGYGRIQSRSDQLRRRRRVRKPPAPPVKALFGRGIYRAKDRVCAGQITKRRRSCFRCMTGEWQLVL